MQTYENWKLAGNSLSSLDQYESALAKYDSASKLMPKETFENEWAEIRSLIGHTKWAIAMRVEWERANLLLREAEEACQQALTVYTRERLPQRWADIQNNLGIILQEHGIHTGGEAGAELLAQAVGAYRNALQMSTREQRPFAWAMTQSTLGTVLTRLGTRIGGEAGMKLLYDAVDAYRQAQTVYTRKQLPQFWAITQNNLGDVLFTLGRSATAIRQVVPQAEVILYGSVARGEETVESDVDLLVLVPQEATYELKRTISNQFYAIELEHEQLIPSQLEPEFCTVIVATSACD